MKFALYHPQDLSVEQWQIYAALRNARPIYDNPFFDPDFARMVGEVREDARIGFASDKEGVFAIWPMHLRPGNWARPIGAPFSDWNGPILSADTKLSAGEILAGFDLSGFTTQGFMPATGAPLKGLQRAGAHITDLSVGAEVFFAEQLHLWPKHYKKMRRVYRKIDNDFSRMEFNWDDRCPETYNRLIELKQAQFARTGYHDVLKAPWVKGLFQRLKSYEGPRMRTRLISLFYDDRHAASEFNLQSDTIMHGWITAFEQEMKAYSPGNMLIEEMLKRMPGEGLYVYDAGPGLDHYKRHYSNLVVPIDAGVVPGISYGLVPSRIAGRAWRLGENILPGKASAIMARARRRMDQIASTEMSLAKRANGFVSALSSRPV